MDNASQVNFSCNSIRSASHHNVLLLPYAPNIFDSLPPPQPRSIPCSHHSTRLSTACPTSWASGSSHRSCSCTAEVPAGHLARQADRLGGHCLSVAGGPSRIDEDSALPILPLVRAPVGHFPPSTPLRLWDWNWPRGSYRGASITSIHFLRKQS